MDETGQQELSDSPPKKAGVPLLFDLTVKNKIAALVEAVLFLESEAITTANLARAVGFPLDAVEEVLEEIIAERKKTQYGLEPVQSGGGWILAPKIEHWEELKARYGKKSDSRLSRAALETLSIIAYSQPITRAEVEVLRGVSADGMVRFLLDKNFIKEVGKKDIPGKPVQYGTTKEFLKYFRLGSIADLPKLGDTEEQRFELLRKQEDVNSDAQEIPSEISTAASEVSTEDGQNIDSTDEN